MSSRSRTRSEAWRAAVAALVVTATQVVGAAPAAAAVPLPVGAVLSRNGETALVVDLSASTRTAGLRTVTVTTGGVRQRAELIPVMSAGLAVALVVDTSAAGAATLPAWLSAGARFILEAPEGSQAVVITDHEPAAAITPALRGPTEVVRALTAVRPSGERDTAAALDLATHQFAEAAAGRRVVIFYTTAADAGTETAADLAAAYRASGSILVVVGTAGDAFWTDAAAATGGFFAPAGKPVVVPALDQVETSLRGRYLVRFPTPTALPALVSVTVDTGDLTLAGDALIPVPRPPATPAKSGDRTLLWSLGGVAALLAVAMMALPAIRSARRRPLGPPGLTAVFRGRAQAPGTVVRGRASLPRRDPRDRS